MRSQPRKRRRRTPEEAEQEILDAAGDLLRRRSAHEVTVAAIMAQTTLSRKSFYVYFRDRHDLLVRLVKPLRAEAKAMCDIWREGTGDPREGGREALAGLARLYHEHGAILRALAQASSHDLDARRAWRGFKEPFITVTAEKIEELGGTPAGVDPRRIARALIGMNVQVFFDEVVGKSPKNIDAAVDTLHRIWSLVLVGRPR